MRSAGGGIAWFRHQVANIPADAGRSVADWWPELHQTPAKAAARDAAGIQRGSELANLVASREMARRVTSPHQVLETMAEFWHHQLHVPADGGDWSAWRAHYTDTIRSRALGRFDLLLQAAVTHPAMLTYLNANQSKKARPNENLARELLELHSVGAGNFSEDDVKNCARILTGYRLVKDDGWEPGYDAGQHWTGQVQVLGFRHANAQVDGRQVVRDLLSYLARHPCTADRLALRLAQAFVGDSPPPGLVARLAESYLAADTAILPVLETLITSSGFVASKGAKVRNPEQDVVATYRALGVRISRPTTARSASILMWFEAQNLGLAPLSWPTPDGSPLRSDRWATPARAMASLKFHWNLANKATQASDLKHRTIRQWLPKLPMRVDEVVEVLSLEILGRSTPPEVLSLVCSLAGVRPRERITRNHHMLVRSWGQVLGLFLEHPSRYFR